MRTKDGITVKVITKAGFTDIHTDCYGYDRDDSSWFHIKKMWNHEIKSVAVYNPNEVTAIYLDRYEPEMSI